VVKAMTILMELPAAEGEVFNVAGNVEITMRQLAELVIERTSSSSAIIYVPYEDVYGDGFEDMSSRAADTSKLKAATGFHCDTSLVEILDSMIEFARESAQTT
jgi:UDP-glucose 4-epimerase